MKIFRFTLFFIYILAISCNRPKINPTLSGYTERSKCKSCHEEIYEKYTGSHHDLAMMPANSESVLGHFDTTIVHLGDAAKFYQKNGEYYVFTKGDKGKYQDFKVAYTFGWTPLQQYLMEFPNGAFQVLPFCWDSRPKADGGQRWYHIYDQEKIPHDDFLFWTKPQQNWNHVCAECHSTKLEKNYIVDSLSFNTNWSEIDVSCDACHGPSENHLKWAELDEMGKSTKKYLNMGYAFRFPNDSAEWVFKEGATQAFRSVTRTEHKEIELCARCHSLRMQIWGDYIHGEELLQTHIPEVLEPHLYHLDGQIKEEDYEYGSFLQSTMYKRGVTCTNCHDPHSYQLKAPVNILCSTCHSSEKYNTKEHHFHEDEEGSNCRNCHMPMSVYMGVDKRYDHSFRIPRPDQSLKLGVPNACNKCHEDKSTQWADEWFRKWYGNKYDTIGHYGNAFHAANNQHADALEQLIKVINDTANTDIVRATAIYYFQHVPNAKATELARKLTNDPSALVRLTAMRVLSNLEGNRAVGTAIKLLNDSVRAVRHEAFLTYTRTPKAEISSLQKKQVTQSMVDEYIKMLNTNSDQAASYVNLGIYYINQGMPDSAMAVYNIALAVDSSSIEAAINIADIYRELKQDKQGEIILLGALKKNPGRPEVYNTLGLLYTRNKETSKALAMFQKAHELLPENSYYIYIYALALNANGQAIKAIELLEKGYKLDRYDQNILYALAAFYRDLGDDKKYQFYYQKIQELNGTAL